MKGIPSFWVDCADRVNAESNSLWHKTAHGELIETKDWIPKDGKLRIGVTSGASTPDRAVEDVLDKVFTIRDPLFAGIERKSITGPSQSHH